ncbi:hypothetical protein [Amycolatopsis sp. NPDC052450]
MGRTLINLTADTPARSPPAAAWAAEHGVHYVDGRRFRPLLTEEMRE